MVALSLSTQMVRQKSTPRLVGMVFILSLAFQFLLPFVPTSAKQSIQLNYMVPYKPCALQVQPGLQYVLNPLMYGATGAALRWTARGWLNSAGSKVPNVTLWEEEEAFTGIGKTG